MIQINLKPIEIRLIHAEPWQELIKEGWLNSRPHLNPADDLNFIDVLKIDTPVSELAGITMEMTVPILFREIICSARDHVVWARTSRVDNLTEEWNIYEGITEFQKLEIADLAAKLTEESGHEAQDEFRKNLPLGYMTSFTTKLSIRSAIKMVKYFLSLAARDSYIRTAASTFAFNLEAILEELGVPVGEVLQIVKSDDLSPLTKGKGRSFAELGDHIIIEGDYSIMLRSQIIRHRLLHVVDDLCSLFELSNVWSVPISRKMHLSIGAPRHIWEGIVGKRLCWLAHSSIWADIINDVTQVSAEAIGALIPCKDGICPYNEDCRQRIMLNDPGLPCPRHLNLTGAIYKEAVENNFDPMKLKPSMIEYIEKSGRPKSYWLKEILNCVNPN